MVHDPFVKVTPASCKLLFSEVSLKYKITKTVPDSLWILSGNEQAAQAK